MMFENTTVAFMFMLLLCFMGTLVMFLFILRALSQHATLAKELHRQNQATLADMERQLLDIHYLMRQAAENTNPAQPERQDDFPQDVTELFTTYTENKTGSPQRSTNNGAGFATLDIGTLGAGEKNGAGTKPASSMLELK